MRIALVYNPNSAGRRLARIGALTRVLGKRGHVVTQHDSMTFRFPRDAPDAELLCLCGGDGTARLVIDGQEDLAALPPLAVYPMGTINLLARELGYPRDARGFAERIESDARSRVCRVGVAGERRFLACASLGADAWVVAGLSTVLKARVGRLAYVASLVRLLWNWPNGRFRVQAGGEVFAAEALFVLRGSYYAGPWTLDREANLPPTHCMCCSCRARAGETCLPWPLMQLPARAGRTGAGSSCACRNCGSKPIRKSPCRRTAT